MEECFQISCIKSLWEILWLITVTQKHRGKRLSHFSAAHWRVLLTHWSRKHIGPELCSEAHLHRETGCQPPSQRTGLILNADSVWCKGDLCSDHSYSSRPTSRQKGVCHNRGHLNCCCSYENEAKNSYDTVIWYIIITMFFQGFFLHCSQNFSVQNDIAYTAS